MIFNDHTQEFLSGEEFSSGHSFHVQSTPLRDRFSLFAEFFEKRKVIHVGCVDHLPLLSRKIQEDTWVHGAICKVAERCVGVDINGKGIEILRTQYSCKDVYCCDITTEYPPGVCGQSWDYLFLGEVLEHVDNPVEFLGKIHSGYGEFVRTILVTVPNALRIDNFLNARRNAESVNTDHRFWFTPFTLAKVLTRAGFTPTQCELVAGFPAGRIRGLRGRVRRWALDRYPLLRDTLAMTAVFEMR